MPGIADIRTRLAMDNLMKKDLHRLQEAIPNPAAFSPSWASPQPAVRAEQAPCYSPPAEQAVPCYSPTKSLQARHQIQDSPYLSPCAPSSPEQLQSEHKQIQNLDPRQFYQFKVREFAPYKSDPLTD